jgi:hypothetical protein
MRVPESSIFNQLDTGFRRCDNLIGVFLAALFVHIGVIPFIRGIHINHLSEICSPFVVLDKTPSRYPLFSSRNYF